MSKKRESLRELVARLVPCTIAYWSPEARKLEQAAKQGLCKQTLVAYPMWRFTNIRRKATP